MHSYRFHAQPNLPRGYGWAGIPDLTAATFTQALAGSAVKAIVATSDGGYDVHVALNRETHQQALEEMWAVLQEAGYSYVQAIVTEWVTSAVEGAMLGGLSGTAVGSRAKDAGTTVLSMIVGGIMGAALGSLKETARATYRAHRSYPYGGWQLVQLQPLAV